MKILLILITTIVFSLPSFAKGEIDYVKSANNVTLIGSNTNIGSIINAGAMKRGMIIAIANSKKAPLIYSLEQYTSNNKQQYALKVWVSPNKKMPSILNSNGKLLLKTAKGNNIELTSCFTEATINEAWNLSYTSSIFPSLAALITALLFIESSPPEKIRLEPSPAFCVRCPFSTKPIFSSQR